MLALSIKSKLMDTCICIHWIDIPVKFPRWYSTDQQHGKYIVRMTPSETHNPEYEEGDEKSNEW